MTRTAIIVVAAAMLTPVVAQRILESTYLAPGVLVTRLRPALDTNSDGIDDFVAVTRDLSVPGQSTYRVYLVDGSSGAMLWQLGPPLPSEPLDVVGFGDGDGDGRGDVAVTHNNTIVYSGATGGPLYTQSQRFRSLCELGDYDGNGRADFAGAYYNNNGENIVMLMRGESASQFQSLSPVPNPSGNCTLRNVGDVSGDGRDDVVLCPVAAPTVVLDTDSGQVMHTLNVPGPIQSNRKVEAIDLDGDGLREVLVLRPSSIDRIEVYGGGAGVFRFAVSAPPGSSTAFGQNACALGDLNNDGFVDFASGLPQGSGKLVALSGRNGDVLWSLETSLFLQLGQHLCRVGDIDGDGLGDLATSFRDSGPTGPPETGWHVISSTVVADAVDIGGACGAGPFLPRLGMTRPILGQNTTVALLDGPVGANGVLAFSLQPPWPSYLGVSTCAAGFDLGNAVAIYLPTQPAWTITIPLPPVPQFAGLPIALQCFYSPTSGPLGLDLSNAVWARIGFP